MKVRRVVTGHSPEGKSVIVSDTKVDAIPITHIPGQEYHTLWGADSLPVFPDNGSSYATPTYFPPVGGFRFGMFTVPPDSSISLDQINIDGLIKEYEEKLPGLITTMEPDNPGMHTTNTIDFEYVISGEVWLELDDGKQVHLEPGDTVVQNGTHHAWRNKGTEPCTMVVCLIGVNRK